MKKNTTLILALAAAAFWWFSKAKPVAAGTTPAPQVPQPPAAWLTKTVYPDYMSAAKVAPPGAGVGYSSNMGGYTLIPASQMIPGSTVPLAGMGDEVVIDVPRPAPIGPGSIWWGYMD